MLIENSSYTVTEKIKYTGTSFDESYHTIREVFDFAYDMTFGKNGQHRNYRSGGSARRKNGEIFANTFQGKLAEVALYTLLKNADFNPEELDFERYDLGKWDFADIECSKGKIAVKSTKSFGNLLLLETKDWNSEGEYKPNNTAYDYLFLVRISGDIDGILKKNKLYYLDECRKEELEKIINGENWSYDIPGYLSLKDLKLLIAQNKIIPRGSLLNGTTTMDAENFYEEAGNLRRIKKLQE